MNLVFPTFWCPLQNSSNLVTISPFLHNATIGYYSVFYIYEVTTSSAFYEMIYGTSYWFKKSFLYRQSLTK